MVSMREHLDPAFRRRQHHRLAEHSPVRRLMRPPGERGLVRQLPAAQSWMQRRVLLHLVLRSEKQRPVLQVPVSRLLVQHPVLQWMDYPTGAMMLSDVNQSDESHGSQPFFVLDTASAVSS